MIPIRFLSQQLFIFLILTLTLASAAQPPGPVYFEDVLEKRFPTGDISGWTLEKFCPVSTSVVAMRVLQDYGAMFSAVESVILPTSCIHAGEGDVLRYQKKLITKPVDVGGISLAFQAPAADALQSAINEATANGLSISPFDGAIGGQRSYGDTIRLWNSRFFPAMEYWIKRGRLTTADRDEINGLDLSKKIEKVLEWESRGIYFSTDRTRSIFTSTAPPGASQHLSLIALDVTEFWNNDVRSILNRNGWFQTVIDDPVHFTYLGFSESELPGRGLLAVFRGGRQYWIPNMRPQLTEPKATPAPTNLY